ncbi:MAG: 3-phosphoserine/phosphohydroxythreonine transaminase, partial [Planctomycetota bacterium]|nr:3-phosphoserine/phosphohydroxythreonine transaminase [Planctomycetota bacterium]
MSERVFNFSSGPAVLPVSVLERIRDEILCLPGVGASILEISHRSSSFEAIMASAQSNLRQLLSIPNNYRILFLQGGSRLQFSMIPMNLLRGSGATADYILTGTWGIKAFEEAVKEGPVNVAWDGKSNYKSVPQPSELKISANSAYVYYTSNETIQGVQFATPPAIGRAPLVCDASSDFLCRPLNIADYGLIYACAQKNAGPAGVTIVIIREDLLARGNNDLPGYLRFANHDEENSLYNTPPTFGIYVVDLVAQWLLREMGGLSGILKHNQKKSQLLYDVIDQYPSFYHGHAEPSSRSLMNVTFRLPNDELQTAFLSGAKKHRLHELKGHRSVGGIRASIYNAM